nr:uncharacterized protein LOC129264891 isoform X1 [Lytechinus pictus]
MQIFNDLGSEILDSSFDGYNVCLFAYGQTGSGKTFTMMGDETDQGVIPRLCESLLERVSSYEEDVTFKVEVSFLEIYNERVRDLLAPPNKAKYSLKVREHPKDGPYVQDLSHHLVSDYEQVLALMHDGNLLRTTAATHMHELSSRSHAIFTITFIQAKMSHGIPSEIVSKINLVDLAGSERASINTSKDRLQEGANINKSLVTLGNCIQALGPHVDLSKSLPDNWLTSRHKRAADSAAMAASMESLSMSEDWDALSGPRRRTNYVPYRNSILTWLLKDSLGGNSKTIMIATISPASIHYNETMSTLRYARRAKHIVNQPIINEDRNVRLIRELRAEIDRLRMLLNSASLASSQASLIQDQNICRMLQENEQRVDQLTEAWVEKWSNAARIMQECNVGIRKESVGVIVESELPHLIGMDDDLLSTGIILYHLKEGRTKIGRTNSVSHQDIVLYGPDVEDEHAVIINIDGHVVLTPLRNSKCAVNGINVHKPVELTQGAVILLGSTNMFRFNHPAEAVKLRERRASNIPGRGLRRKSVTLHVPNSGDALSAEFGKRISLSMSLDGSWSAEPDSNLKKTPMRSSFSDLSSDISPIMMFNPGLELERRHKLEAEKLEDTRKQLAELEARRAEAVAAREEQELMMKRSLHEHQERIREQKELIERLKKEHQEAMALAQEELAMMKGKISNQKEMGKQKLEGELTQLKDTQTTYHSDLCTIPSVVADISIDTKDLSGLDVARKRVTLMELLQKQSQRKALAALERRQATLEVQKRTAQLILKHEEQKLQDFETDPRLLEGEFSSESPEKELGDRDMENTVDSSTENVSTELPASGRVSPVGNSDPETMHHNNLPSPKRETKRIQKQEKKDQIVDKKKDQMKSSKKNSRNIDARPAKKVELGPPKYKPREEQLKRESDGQSASSSRSPSPSKSSRSSSPSKSSRSSSPTKSLRSDSPTKSSRSASPSKSVRSDSPTKSSRSSSPASTSSRRSRQSSGDVFSRLFPQQETKFDYLRKKSPPRYSEYDPHRERDRDSPYLIRRELSPSEHDPIKLKDRKHEFVQDHKHMRTNSVPSSNLPDRTKNHSRSRSASPSINKPIKPVARPKKSPLSQSSQKTDEIGRKTKVKPKDTVKSQPERTQSDRGNEKKNNKCQANMKRAHQTTPQEQTLSSPTKRKSSKPENTLKLKTPKGSSASPSRSRPSSSQAIDRSPSPKKKSEQTPSHRKTVKRPLSRSRNDNENSVSPSPRRKFARTPVVKPKNWPSLENLPKSTPKSEAFYVPLTSEQLRLELQKHTSEQDSGLYPGNLGALGCEQPCSPSHKRSIGKHPQETQTDPNKDTIGVDTCDLEMDGINVSINVEDCYSSSESFVDSLEEDIQCDQQIELEHDDGPRIVDMTSADEDEFWAIPVSSEDILTASSDEGEDDEDDIALNLDIPDRKHSSDTLESVNSNDELETDDPCHTTMMEVENSEAIANEEQGSADSDDNSCNSLHLNGKRPLPDDDVPNSEKVMNAPIVCDHEEANGDISCHLEHSDNEPTPAMQREDEIIEESDHLDEIGLDEDQTSPSETHLHNGDNVLTEPPTPNIELQQKIVEPKDQELGACERDKGEQIAEVTDTDTETQEETSQVNFNEENAVLPLKPNTTELHSMPDLPDECLSSRKSSPASLIKEEINKPSNEVEPPVVPDRNVQEETKKKSQDHHGNISYQEPLGEIHGEEEVPPLEFTDDNRVRDPVDPYEIFDDDVVRSTSTKPPCPDATFDQQINKCLGPGTNEQNSSHEDLSNISDQEYLGQMLTGKALLDLDKSSDYEVASSKPLPSCSSYSKDIIPSNDDESSVSPARNGKSTSQVNSSNNPLNIGDQESLGESLTNESLVNPGITSDDEELRLTSSKAPCPDAALDREFNKPSYSDELCVSPARIEQNDSQENSKNDPYIGDQEFPEKLLNDEPSVNPDITSDDEEVRSSSLKPLCPDSTFDKEFNKPICDRLCVIPERIEQNMSLENSKNYPSISAEKLLTDKPSVNPDITSDEEEVISPSSKHCPDATFDKKFYKGIYDEELCVNPARDYQDISQENLKNDPSNICDQEYPGDLLTDEFVVNPDKTPDDQVLGPTSSKQLSSGSIFSNDISQPTHDDKSCVNPARNGQKPSHENFLNDPSNISDQESPRELFSGESLVSPDVTSNDEELGPTSSKPLCPDSLLDKEFNKPIYDEKSCPIPARIKQNTSQENSKNNPSNISDQENPGELLNAKPSMDLGEKSDDKELRPASSKPPCSHVSSEKEFSNPSSYDECYVVPEKYKQKNTECPSLKMNDKESPKDSHCDENIDPNSVDLDEISDNEVVGPLDAETEALEESRDANFDEITFKLAGLSPDIAVNDIEQHISQGSPETDLPFDDLSSDSSHSDDNYDRPTWETEDAEGGNDFEGLKGLKTGEENPQICDSQSLKPCKNENQSSTDMLIEAPMSSHPVLSDGNHGNEACGPIEKLETSNNFDNGNPDQHKETDGDFQMDTYEAYDPVHQESFEESSLAKELLSDLTDRLDPLPPAASHREEAEGQTVKIEMGRNDSPVEVPEINEQREVEEDQELEVSDNEDFPQESYSDEIQSGADSLGGDITSPFSSNPDDVCIEEKDRSCGSDVNVLQTEGDSDIPGRNDLQHKEDDHFVDINDICNQTVFQEEQQMNEPALKQDLPECVTSRPSSLNDMNVACNKQNDEESSTVFGSGDIRKPDIVLVRKTDEELPKVGGNIEQHSELSNLEVFPESNQALPIAEELTSRDLEPSSVFDNKDMELFSETQIPTLLDFPEDHSKVEIEKEVTGNVHDGFRNQPRNEELYMDGNQKDCAVLEPKEAADNAVTILTSSCPCEPDEVIQDNTKQEPRDSGESETSNYENDGMDTPKGDLDDHPQPNIAVNSPSSASYTVDASPANDRDDQAQHGDHMITKILGPDEPKSSKNPAMFNGNTSLESNNQDQIKDNKQPPIPMIAIQSEEDEVPTVSCVVMANQLDQLQRPVIVDLSKFELDSSDSESDEVSSDKVTDDQSEYSEEEKEISQESPLDYECLSPEKVMFPNGESGTDSPDNKYQQKPLDKRKVTQNMGPQQAQPHSDIGPGDDKLEKHGKEDNPKMKSLPDRLCDETYKLLHGNDDFQVMPPTVGTTVKDIDKKAMGQNIPQNIDHLINQSKTDCEDHKIVYGPSDTKDLTNIDKYHSDSHLHQLPVLNGNSERNQISNNHNFRITRASPVPFSDEEMESMESPSSCSSTSAAEYHFDEEQSLSDFLEDVDKVKDEEEEEAMNDNMSALQNSEINEEATDTSDDNGTSNSSVQLKTDPHIPEGMRKRTVPSIQASLPPNVYKSLFNADSPHKQDTLIKSSQDSTLPDDSVFYQSAIDTSLYQTAVESPSAFNKNEIIPLKKTWGKDQIISCSTPTGTPEGTPVSKTLDCENLDQRKYGSPQIDELGGSPLEQELGASPGSLMARKIHVSPDITDLQELARSVDVSKGNENIRPTDISVCHGDINNDTKSGVAETNLDKKDNWKDGGNGEQTRSPYYSPRDLPEQSYILHTLDTIQEEDSVREVSESEDTCSTLHSVSPPNSRVASPNIEHMSVTSPENVHYDVPPEVLSMSVHNEETLDPLDKNISPTHPSELLQNADQETKSEVYKSSENMDKLDDSEDIPTFCNMASQQDDMVSEINESEIESPINKLAENDEGIPAIPSTADNTDLSHIPGNSMNSKEPTNGDTESIDELAESHTRDEASPVESPKINNGRKKKDVFSRLYPKNVPKFDFKRKSEASVIPKEKSHGNVSPKIQRKDLKAKKLEMSETTTEDHLGENILGIGNSNNDETVGLVSCLVLKSQPENFDNISEEDQQKDDIAGMAMALYDPANTDKDHIPEDILEEKPEMPVDDSSKDPLDDEVADDGATNHEDIHKGDENISSDILTTYPEKFVDANESQAVENLKPFLGKDYAVASAKLTMFMKMFGLSVESTDSSEGSDSLRMHKDKGLVDRIVGDGVGYDPDSFECNDSLTNQLSGSPGSVDHKGVDTVPGGNECEDQSWTASDVAVDGDSSIREIRSRSTTVSDMELVSAGDDIMTDSNSAVSLHNIEEDQLLETSSKYPTDFQGLQLEPCVTKSMQLAYPREDITLILRKMDIDAFSSLKHNSAINIPADSSSTDVDKNIAEHLDVNEISEDEISDETKTSKSGSDLDHNHNIDSPPEMKDLDFDETPVDIGKSMLPLSSSVVNDKVPVQIQESVLTPFKVAEMKHPSLSQVGKLNISDRPSRSPENNNSNSAEEAGQEELSSSEVERPLNISNPISDVTEVIYASKVQLEESMVSSSQRFKKLFAKSNEIPDGRDNLPIVDTEGEKEVPLNSTGVVESPVHNRIDNGDCRLLKLPVLEQITVDRVHLPEVSLSSLFKDSENETDSKTTFNSQLEPRAEQPGDPFSVHSQCELEQLEVFQDVPKYQVYETYTKSPHHLPEIPLSAMLMKLGETMKPLSQPEYYDETKFDDAHKPEENHRMNTESLAMEEEQQQKTQDENHDQPDHKQPTTFVSTKYNVKALHDQSRLKEPTFLAHDTRSTQNLSRVHVTEACTEHPISHHEEPLLPMLSKLMESSDSDEHPSQQSSVVDTKGMVIIEPKQKDKCIDSGHSLPKNYQQNIYLEHQNPEESIVSFVDDKNNRVGTGTYDGNEQKIALPGNNNFKKDQGMNTDDPIILVKDNYSHHKTTKEVSHASCSTDDILTQPDSDIRTQESAEEHQSYPEITINEEPIVLKIAHPTNKEPVKWHLLSTDSTEHSTHPQSSMEDIGIITTAVDKSIQCKPSDMTEGQSGDLVSIVLHERKDRSTSPEALNESMHSFKPITPSPRLIIAAGPLDSTGTQIEELSRDSEKGTKDSGCQGKEHRHPSLKINQSPEETIQEAMIEKEQQSNLPSSLNVPPIHSIDGASPAYSPLHSSRSTDDELAQIFAAAKQRSSMKHRFTNTSPVIPASQRSLVDVSTTTDGTTVSAQQTSPIDLLTEQRLVLDASTTTDSSLKLISKSPEVDVDRACKQTSPCNEQPTTASVQTSHYREIDAIKNCEKSFKTSATETVASTQPDMQRSTVDSSAAHSVVSGDGMEINQQTHEEFSSLENRSVGTSPIAQLDLPKSEHFSPLNVKTSTPNIISIDEQETQANLSSFSNNQECQTDLLPSGPSSPSSIEDDTCGPWRKASEVLDELSENMDTEGLELFAVLMHKRRFSEQTVDRVKGLAEKLRKRNQLDEQTLLNPDEGSKEPSENPPISTDTADELSLPQVNSPDVLGSGFGTPKIQQLEDTEKHLDQPKAVLTLSPLPLSETGTREFDFERNEGTLPAHDINTSKDDLQTHSPVDDEFFTLPGQNGSMLPPMVPASEQIPSPRIGLPFDRKPTPPTKTLSEKPVPITDRQATSSQVPLRHVMGTGSCNDWHSLPLQSGWGEPLNRNNNSSTDYSEDDIGIGETATDIFKSDPPQSAGIELKQSPRATLSKFSDVSFDSELDFPVGTNDLKDGCRLDKKDEVNNLSIYASMQSLDSDLFGDGTEPELLALQGDTDDSNANTSSVPVDISHGFVGDNQVEEKDDQREMEEELTDAESLRIHMPPISPSKLEWLLAESEIEPDVKYLPLSKHPEKDKIPLPGFKLHSSEDPYLIEKQPNEALMQKPEGKIHPQDTEVEAYPVKFKLDKEQKESGLSSSVTGPSARSRPVAGYTGIRHANFERTGSSLGESSGIYSLVSEIPHLHQVKTPLGSLDSLINASSTDEERDMQQLQSEYEKLLQGRKSSSLNPVDHPCSRNLQQAQSREDSDDDNKSAQPRSNGFLNGYSSGDSASSSEIDGFVYGLYGQSMDRKDISIELLEAQVMHGIGETDALLKFLDDDLPLEYWTNRKNKTKPQHGEAEQRRPSLDKKVITHIPNNTSNKSPGYQVRKCPSPSQRKSPSGVQSLRSSPSAVTPPPLQRVVKPILDTSPSEKSPSPRGHFRPSEHLKFLKRVRENVVKATANPLSPTPSSPSPGPQLYSLYPSETPSENHRNSSTFSPEKNDMELFLKELREARKMSQSEIAKAEKELQPARRRYSNGEDTVFADGMPGSNDDSRNYPPSSGEKDEECPVKQRTQRSDEDLIDKEIASMRAAAAVILPSTSTPTAGTSPCKDGDESNDDLLEESPSKPHYYELYDLPSRTGPLSRSQNRPSSQFGYSLYKDPPRSHDALTKTYPPAKSLQGEDSKRDTTLLHHQSGGVQLQKYTPLKSTGSSGSLSAPPNRRPTPQPSGVYLSTPQHRGMTNTQEGGSIRSYRGSPGSQVKISPVKSSLRNRRLHGAKPFQELPTVRESKLVWSRPECHLVAEAALHTLMSEMAPSESFDPSKSQQPEEERGWRYEGRERDVLLLCKTHSPNSPINSYIGIGNIKAPARTVFNYIKNPMCRQLYDPMLKEVKIKKDFGSDLQVVYMVFKTDQCLLQHPRDCLCVIKTLEMDDRFLVVATSIKHPRIPPKKKTIRAEVLLAGCSIQPLQTGDMEHCRVTHLSQVNLHGDLQPKLINALSSRLPMCISDLRNVVQIGDV